VENLRQKKIFLAKIRNVMFVKHCIAGLEIYPIYETCKHINMKCKIWAGFAVSGPGWLAFNYKL